MLKTAIKKHIQLNLKWCINRHYTSLLKTSEERLVGVYAKPSLILSHGKGVYLFDTEGKRYLDMTAGIAVSSLGYNDKSIAQCLYEQSLKLMHTSNLFHNEYAGLLADELIQSVKHPDLKTEETSWASQVFFTNSGTEANEGAIKMARKYHFKEGKEELQVGIVSFKGGFHGRSLGALSLTPNPKYQKPFEPLLPGVIHLNFNANGPSIQANITNRIAAVFVEPIQGEGGINVATERFLYDLRQRCNEVGALLVYDEIQCGLGRTGKLFAHHYFPKELAPDIMTIAKPLANGFPIGAILINDKVNQKLTVGDHGTTFGGNPMGCKLGLHVLKRLKEENFLLNVQQIGNYLNEKLNLLKEKKIGIKEIRGYGLIVGIEFEDKLNVKLICEEALKLGLIIITCGQNTIRLVPPLIINKEQIDEFLFIFQQCISNVIEKKLK